MKARLALLTLTFIILLCLLGNTRCISNSSFTNNTIPSHPSKKEKQPTAVSGRLPGPRWREVEPPVKGSLQSFETIHLPEPCLLLLYARESEESASAFMKDFAQRLSQTGKEVVRRENLHLSSGMWLNFTAVDLASVSRIYARKENGWLIWVVLLAPEERSYALFAPEVERYLAQLQIEYE